MNTDDQALSPDDATLPMRMPEQSPSAAAASSSARTGSGPRTGKAWEPPTVAELQAMLPQYEILCFLGRGGMGAVYQGRQVSLDRLVAIKILSNDLEAADASFAERFKNEARAMAKLSHPGIVGVYDFGETASGFLFIVMEFIEGTDVQKMITSSRRLHSEHAMAIAAHVCDALHYAHERGIIHRDIKPANVMVGYDGSVKVADFGLAKMNAESNDTLGLTQSGMAMGTLHYMAPEALMLGTAVDRRADVYAVGVMLYHMLTGRLPHGIFELPSLQVAGLDPRYDGIIAKAMREDRVMRYSDAAELRTDLDGILTRPVAKTNPDEPAAVPAALPTNARPQRPGAGQPYRPPQPQVIVRTEKRGSPLLWTAVVLLAGYAGWTFWTKSQEAAVPVTVSADAEKAAPTTPATPEKPGSTPATQAPAAPGTASTADKTEPSKAAYSPGIIQSRQFELKLRNKDRNTATLQALMAKWDSAAERLAWLYGTEPKRDGSRFVITEYETASSVENGFTIQQDGMSVSSAKLSDMISTYEEKGLIWPYPAYAIVGRYASNIDGKFANIPESTTRAAMVSGLRMGAQYVAYQAMGSDQLDKRHTRLSWSVLNADIAGILSNYESRRIAFTWPKFDAAPYVLAGFLQKLAEQHGGDDFLRRLYAEELPKLPPLASGDAAVREMAGAISRAAGKDLSDFLETQWRWPLKAPAEPVPAISSDEKVVRSRQFELRLRKPVQNVTALKAQMALWDKGAERLAQTYGTPPRRSGNYFVITEYETAGAPEAGFSIMMYEISVSTDRLASILKAYEESNIVWPHFLQAVVWSHATDIESKFSKISDSNTRNAFAFGLRMFATYDALQAIGLDQIDKSNLKIPWSVLNTDCDILIGTHERTGGPEWFKNQGSAFLLTGFLKKIAEEHAGSEFVRRLFAQELSKLSEVADGRQAAVELANAINRASGKDLTDFLIKQWRWPLQKSAETQPATMVVSPSSPNGSSGINANPAAVPNPPTEPKKTNRASRKNEPPQSGDNGLIARYTFDSIDEPGADIRGAEAVNGQLVLDGNYELSGTGGYRVMLNCPSFNDDQFTIAVKMQHERQIDTLLVGGSTRWLTVAAADDTLTVTLGNGDVFTTLWDVDIRTGKPFVLVIAGGGKSGSIQIYLDGKKLQTWQPPAGVNFRSEGQKQILFTNYGNGNTLKGSVDELQVFDRVLTDREVAALKFGLPGTQVNPSAKLLSWIDVQGRRIEAQFVRLEQGRLTLRMDGRENSFPLALLSDASRRQAEELAQAASQP